MRGVWWWRCFVFLGGAFFWSMISLLFPAGTESRGRAVPEASRGERRRNLRGAARTSQGERERARGRAGTRDFPGGGFPAPAPSAGGLQRPEGWVSEPGCRRRPYLRRAAPRADARSPTRIRRRCPQTVSYTI